MIHRWVGAWLAVFFGLPLVAAVVYVVVYQGWLDTRKFYPFWRAESYYYFSLPAVALAAWRIHWGIRHPLPYAGMTLLLAGGVALLGTFDWVENHGSVEKETLILQGIAEDQLISGDQTLEIPYFPYNRDQVITAIQQKQPVEVYRIRGKPVVLAFVKPAFASYPVGDRLINLAIGLLAAGVFSVFFLVVIGEWYRHLKAEEGRFILFRWGKRREIPLENVIHVHLDEEMDEIVIETENTVFTFPHDPKVVGRIARIMKTSGLYPLKNGRRWVRTRQFEEIRIQPDRLLLVQSGEENPIRFTEIGSLRWDGTSQITSEDGELDVLITDRLYADREWFDELSGRVRAVWERDGKGYTVEVDPKDQSVHLATEAFWD